MHALHQLLQPKAGCGIAVVFTFIACSEMIRSHGCGTHSAYMYLVAMHACKMCINQSSMQVNTVTGWIIRTLTR